MSANNDDYHMQRFSVLHLKEHFDYPTANFSTTWTNTEMLPYSVNFTDGSWVRAILVRGSYGSKFACGFYCNGIVQTNSASGIGAILNLTASGELVLQDVDGSTVWTTQHYREICCWFKLNDEGNLMLFDENSSLVWQSFDHPTHCLVLGQILFLRTPADTSCQNSQVT
ncbi:putative bulb-type lectin domain-containing protein [Helianthus anomalus]